MWKFSKEGQQLDCMGSSILPGIAVSTSVPALLNPSRSLMF
jgi:hypothetical protein